MEHTSLENMKKNDSVNFAYQEKLKQTDKSEGAFINTGMTYLVIDVTSICRVK